MAVFAPLGLLHHNLDVGCGHLEPLRPVPLDARQRLIQRGESAALEGSLTREKGYEGRLASSARSNLDAMSLFEISLSTK